MSRELTQEETAHLISLLEFVAEHAILQRTVDGKVLSARAARKWARSPAVRQAMLAEARRVLQGLPDGD